MRILLGTWLFVVSVVGEAGAAIVIDGVVGEPEWATATRATNSVVSNWTSANRLDRLSAFTDADNLYIAIEGAVSGNAIVLYTDSKSGGVANLGSLTDNTGTLDAALSSTISTSGGFAADFGWGTLDMNRSSTTADDRLGWRDILNFPSSFTWLYGADYPAACGTSACETRIPLSALGGSGDILVFVRLCDPSGTYFANQNLPMDNSSNPQSVSTWMTVPRATADVTDASTPPAALRQWPNPFRGQTAILCSLPEDEHARLDIFDVHGRRVRVLLDAELRRGTHQTVWDGRDDLGLRVAPGCFLARFETAHRVETARIVLVR